MTRDEAHDVLQRCKIVAGANFFTLSAREVSALLREADKVKYRQPKNANGSRGRYFYARVCRALDRKE